MQGKSVLCCIGMLFFVQSDIALSTQFDYRFSLLQSEIHLEIGEIEKFEPYAYLLQNRHRLAEDYEKRFAIHGDVDVTALGEYDVAYNDEFALHVVVEDKTPPQLTLQSFTLKQNTAFAWNEKNKLSVIKELSDNETDLQTLQNNFTCENIDTSISGNQVITCSVNDNSENIAKAKLSVHIEALSSDVTTTQVMKTANVRKIPAAQYSAAQTAQIKEIAALVNQIRAKNGLAPVVLDMGNYHNVTYLRTQEVLRKYSHVRPDGRACHTIFIDYGILTGSVGENIARGQQSADEVVEDWMNSPTHRENILRAEFTRISVGVAGSGVEKVWVQEFFS